MSTFMFFNLLFAKPNFLCFTIFSFFILDKQLLQQSQAASFNIWRRAIRQDTSNENDYPISLYDNNTPLVELNDRNFIQTIFGSNYSSSSAAKIIKQKPAYVVEFYASWCGHCQKFAPVWSKLAWETKNWQKIVKIGAVNCALKRNELLCLSNNVTYYPMIKYFPRNAEGFSNGINVEKNGEETLKLRKSIIGLVLQEYARENYLDWPNFNYLPNTHNMSLLHSNFTNSDESKYIALIFEDNNQDYVGAEVMLDFSSVNVLQIRRVLFNNPLALRLNIEIFPTLILLDKNTDEIIYKSDFHTDTIGELNQILLLSTTDHLERETLTTTTIEPSTTTLTIEQLKSRFVLSETDLLLTAKHSLLNAISSGYLEIGESKLKHLKNFVNLLKLYFPPVSPSLRKTLRTFGITFPGNLRRSQRARKFFADLELFLVNNANKTITRNQWIREFEDLEIKHDKPFPARSQYVHCRGSKPIFRGYTCGLWTMFHTLTVNAFYERGFRKINLGHHFEPLSILKAIQGYVENFFACSDCAAHFVDMVTRSFRMEDFVHNAADVVLYLWQAHNIVNHRLAGSNTEDPVMPKVQFPPVFLCSHCRNSTTGRWIENGVLHFLTTFYGSNIKAHDEL